MLVSLNKCCPSSYWAAAESSIADELIFRHIGVIVETASNSEPAFDGVFLRKAADRVNADGAIAVVREDDWHATIYVLARSPSAEHIQFRKIEAQTTGKPDAAVIASIRAAETLSAECNALARYDAESPVSASERGTHVETDVKDAQEKSGPSPKNEPRPNAPERFYLNAGGLFGFSESSSGVRSGFVLGSGIRTVGNFYVMIDVGYQPFGPEIDALGDTSDIDFLAVRGRLGRRFLEDKRIRPSLRIGGGVLWAFADGVRTDSGQVVLTHDTTHAGLLCAGAEVQFLPTSRIALLVGADIGVLFPRIVLQHRSRTVSVYGRPIIEWTAGLRVYIF